MASNLPVEVAGVGTFDNVEALLSAIEEGRIEQDPEFIKDIEGALCCIRGVNHSKNLVHIFWKKSKKSQKKSKKSQKVKKKSKSQKKVIKKSKKSH